MSYEIAVKLKSDRVRDEHDFYPTPAGLCRRSLDLVSDREPWFILDPGAGAGPWGQAARVRWPWARIDGVDLRPIPRPTGYNEWYAGCDYLAHPFLMQYDLIIGNPPYKYAEAFIRRSLGLLAPWGEMVLLLRLAFLEGQARGVGLWRDARPAHVAVCSRRPSFTGNAKTDATAYAVFVWRKGHTGSTELSWLDWEYEEAHDAHTTQQ